MLNRSAWPFFLAISLGAAITWIDTRPSWDDTGVTAALIFIATAACGFIRPSLAWAFALCVALWIPMWGLLHGNHATLIALVVGFGGAYTGATARRLIASMAR